MQDTDTEPDPPGHLRQFGITIAVAIAIFGVMWLVAELEGPLHYIEWDLARFALLGLGLSLAITLPASTLVRLVEGRAAAIGLTAYLVAVLLFWTSNSGTAPGVQKFYEIAATTLPVLMLALVLDAGLFESLPSSPVSLAFEVIVLISGEGASLIGVTYETTSATLFAITAAALISAFATLVTSGIGRAAGRLGPNAELSPLTQLFSTAKPRTDDKPGAVESDKAGSDATASPPVDNAATDAGSASEIAP